MTPQKTTAVKTATMLSYHGDPAVKQKYLDRVEMHRVKRDWLIAELKSLKP